MIFKAWLAGVLFLYSNTTGLSGPSDLRPCRKQENGTWHSFCKFPKAAFFLARLAVVQSEAIR